MRVPGGYVDLQVNGGWGHHFGDDPSSIWVVGERLAEHGVTAFLPTLVSSGFPALRDCIDVLRKGPPADWIGARPVGWHLEGPFLAPERAGAHPVDALRRITDADLDLLSRRNGVRLVTLAPELPGAHDAIERLCARGVAVSIGHTSATELEAEAAFEAGASMATHLFNAMSGLHHREPGAAAAVLRHPTAAVGLIADGFHVSPSMVDLAWRLAHDRIVLVSDAIAPAGTTTQPVGRLPDGRLAGATVAVDRCVQNLVRFSGCSLSDAASAASSRAAAVIGHEPRPDDWVELDEDGTVLATSVSGHLVEPS